MLSSSIHNTCPESARPSRYSAIDARVIRGFGDSPEDSRYWTRFCKFETKHRPVRNPVDLKYSPGRQTATLLLCAGYRSAKPNHYAVADKLPFPRLKLRRGAATVSIVPLALSVSRMNVFEEQVARIDHHAVTPGHVGEFVIRVHPEVLRVEDVAVARL